MERANSYIDAINLRPGARLRTARGDFAEVVGTRVYDVDVVAHNLTVADLHTYYAGPTPVLVHNCDPLELPPGSKDTPPITTRQADDLAKHLGYRPIRQINPKGGRIYTNGKSYISRDMDGHKGGIWKIAKSPEALLSKTSRTASTDALLTPIAK